MARGWCVSSQVDDVTAAMTSHGEREDINVPPPEVVAGWCGIFLAATGNGCESIACKDEYILPTHPMGDAMSVKISI